MRFSESTDELKSESVREMTSLASAATRPASSRDDADQKSVEMRMVAV